MNDDASRALGDLAMCALDTIIADYGEDAQLVAASIVFEVCITDPDDPTDDLYHVNYRSLPGNSPMHIGGMLHSTAQHIFSPASDAEEDS